MKVTPEMKYDNDVTLSVEFLFVSGLTRMDWGASTDGLPRWNADSCEPTNSLSLKAKAAEGAVDSVIQLSSLPELDRMPLLFFLCKAGE